MRIRGRSFLSFVAIILLIAAVVPLATLQAQNNNNIVISLVMSSFNADTITPQMITDFQTANPGVNVNLVKYDPSIPAETSGLDAYLTGIQTYATQGDVLYIDSQRTRITTAATSAGYFLDLAPLASSDANLKVDDFIPAMYNSFQWDKGLWALPISADALIMTYDPAAFDKVGLAYPDAKWTMTDIVAAADKLTVKDPSGAVTQAGFAVTPATSYEYLFRSLLGGDGFYDASTVPNLPKFDSPAAEALFDSWIQLETNKEIGTSQNDFQNDAMSIGNVSTFLRPGRGNNNAPVRKGVLLPGGKSGLSVQGFAVSGGTQHPEQAYALAAFLTTRSELVNRGSITPSRKSLIGGNSSGGNGGGGNGFRTSITPDVQALIDTALANAMTPGDMRYADYLPLALKNMQTNGVTSKVALQDAETQANTDEQAAIAKKSANAINVATPVPTQVLTAGKVAINFGMTSFVSPMPNQDQWNALIQQFTASDPQVGRITFDTTPQFGQISAAVQKYDCFYLPYNAVPTVDLGLVLNIDPLMAGDSTFDKTDMIGNVMDQVSRDSKTWAYPIMVQPTILQYDADAFAKANLQPPTSNFTINEFNDDVKALRPDPSLPAPFSSNSNGTALLILMADYGGLPLDYRTNPPTVDFTSQATVDAITQVLDLAKNGYIDYTALSALNFGGGGQNNLETAIYGNLLNAFNGRARQGNANGAASKSTYKPASYPIGKTYSAVSFSIGTAYISATSQNPEGCYRWITTIAKHPELFSAMPARRSMLDDPALAGAQGADTVALYHQVDNLMSSPNTVALPSLQGAGGSPSLFLLQHWLFEAFDNYVLNGKDLTSSLKDAQGYVTTFQACAAAIPPFDPTTQNQRDYNAAFTACATKADPRLKTAFGG